MSVKNSYRPSTYISRCVSVAATAGLAFLTCEDIACKKNTLGTDPTEGEKSGIHRCLVFVQLVLDCSKV